MNAKNKKFEGYPGFSRPAMPPDISSLAQSPNEGWSEGTSFIIWTFLSPPVLSLTQASKELWLWLLRWVSLFCCILSIPFFHIALLHCAFAFYLLFLISAIKKISQAFSNCLQRSLSGWKASFHIITRSAQGICLSGPNKCHCHQDPSTQLPVRWNWWSIHITPAAGDGSAAIDLRPCSSHLRCTGSDMMSSLSFTVVAARTQLLSP